MNCNDLLNFQVKLLDSLRTLLIFSHRSTNPKQSPKPYFFGGVYLPGVCTRVHSEGRRSASPILVSTTRTLTMRITTAVWAGLSLLLFVGMATLFFAPPHMAALPDPHGRRGGGHPWMAPHRSEEEAVQAMMYKREGDGRHRNRAAAQDRITIKAPQLKVVLTKAAAKHGGYVYGYDAVANTGNGGWSGGAAAAVRSCCWGVGVGMQQRERGGDPEGGREREREAYAHAHIYMCVYIHIHAHAPHAYMNTCIHIHAHAHSHNDHFEVFFSSSLFTLFLSLFPSSKND